MNHAILKNVIYDQHRVIKESSIIARDMGLDKNVNYIITGVRRSGKTSLLYKRVLDYIEEDYSWDQIIYINFDDERLIGFNASDFNDIILTAR